MTIAPGLKFGQRGVAKLVSSAANWMAVRKSDAPYPSEVRQKRNLKRGQDDVSLVETSGSSVGVPHALEETAAGELKQVKSRTENTMHL